MQIHECGELFEAVQLTNVLGDGKIFPDCVPKRALEEIVREYERQKIASDFDLKKFVDDHFHLPPSYSADYHSDPSHTAEQHIKNLWNALTRQPDEAGGSLLPLPHPYIVPGGRFREIYYWDSYFTMLGLQVSGRTDLIESMVKNFSYLIETQGYIPNGNRSYFVGRSQPPFFSLMVGILRDEKSKVVTKEEDIDPLITYLPQLEKEYQFWMKGTDMLTEKINSAHRVVRMPDGSILNRYWDEYDTPRPEAYKEDVELSHQATIPSRELFRHLRAAAESGWDFSSRWFRDGSQFSSIHTTEIIPVDLNCLLLHLEKILAEAYQLIGHQNKSSAYTQKSIARKAAIRNYCWSDHQQFFFDYDFVKQEGKEHFTLAAVFPLFFEVATPDQALAVEKIVHKKFLKPRGLTTTLVHSGQQWDAPNGWAPLQWIAFKGLLNYGLQETASQLRTNWIQANETVFAQSGKMTEKYDVWNHSGEASGGEYPNQDGFGWTNGVYLALKNYVV